jgi:hypothetical protein
MGVYIYPLLTLFKLDENSSYNLNCVMASNPSLKLSTEVFKIIDAQEHIYISPYDGKGQQLMSISWWDEACKEGLKMEDLLDGIDCDMSRDFFEAWKDHDLFVIS